MGIKAILASRRLLQICDRAPLFAQKNSPSPYGLGERFTSDVVLLGLERYRPRVQGAGIAVGVVIDPQIPGAVE